MDIKACVLYRGGLAHYLIRQEHEGIYLAQLSRYDGRLDHYPPYTITLIQGIHHWEGNLEDYALLQELGKVIERKLSSGNPIRVGSKQKGTRN